MHFSGVTSYGSVWRKDVANQCLEFELYIRSLVAFCTVITHETGSVGYAFVSHKWGRLSGVRMHGSG